MTAARSSSRLHQRPGSHQMRAPLFMLLVSSSPSSVRSISREWTQRRERSTPSATSRALTVGASLSRIISSKSSSVTLRGRPPAPIAGIHPGWVINRTNRGEHEQGREQQIEVSSHAGYTNESQSPWGMLRLPARTNARGWLSDATTMKAITANGLDSIEFSGDSEPCKQSTACGPLREGAQ